MRSSELKEGNHAEKVRWKAHEDSQQIRAQRAESSTAHEPRAPPPGIKRWPRAGDRRRLDPKPLVVTVMGVTVYKREYQEHSEVATAEWRIQDDKDEADKDEKGKEEVPGEALMREIREFSEEMDKEIREQEKKEKDERQKKKREKEDDGNKEERNANQT